MFMGVEILVVGLILIFLFNYIGTFSFNKFVEDNKVVFSKLKEDDYDFYVISKYGIITFWIIRGHPKPNPVRSMNSLQQPRSAI